MSFFSRLPHTQRRGPRDPRKGSGKKCTGPLKVFFTPCADAGSHPGRIDRAWELQRDPTQCPEKAMNFFCRLPHWRGPRTGGKGTQQVAGGSLNFREDPGRAETGPTFIVRSDSFFFFRPGRVELGPAAGCRERTTYREWEVKIFSPAPLARTQDRWKGDPSRLQGDPTRGRKKMLAKAFFTPCADAGSHPGRMDRAWGLQRDPTQCPEKP